MRSLPSQNYLGECPFHLVGLVTLVDTNRDLVVLQDSTGAIAVDLGKKTASVEPGQRISLQAAAGSPYVTSFPDYPYRPSGWDIRHSFEAPLNWGDYHLTRMRGYLHPAVTGEYTFWIASDNSSELWLSTDEDPAKVRRIAWVRQGDWVNSREWSRYASQRSQPIFLQGRQAYYIEAFGEQLTLDENLAVAWEVKGLTQSVIEDRYLSPYISGPAQSRFAETRGILREYWTNFSAGNLVGLTGSRAFDSALTAKGIEVAALGEGSWPEPRRIGIDQQLRSEDDYCWVELEGIVSFAGRNRRKATLELTDGRERVQVRIPASEPGWPEQLQGWRVRVQGVCEGMHNENGQLVPGIIWAPGGRQVKFMEPPNTNLSSFAPLSPRHFTVSSGFTNRAWGGFLSARGVVTFNGRVFNKDCLYMQDDATGIFISQSERYLGNQLRIGQWAELGGAVEPGRYAPSLHPMVVTVLGWRPMPEPSVEPVEAPVPPSRDGQWTEVEGVVRSVNPDATLVLMGRKDSVSVWIDGIASHDLARYIDSTLRVRGVLSLTMRDGPLLLVPSRSFVEVEENAPPGPFAVPARPIASLDPGRPGSSWVHRVRIAGEVIYREQQLLFVQDGSSGARVQVLGNPPVRVGDCVEVAGFPERAGSSLTLTESLVRVAQEASEPLKPRSVNLAGAGLPKSDGTLVRLRATLLVQKTKDDGSDILELQQGDRLFEAILPPSGPAKLPPLETGSLLGIVGVCDVELADSREPARVEGSLPAASVRIRLRSPADVTLVKSMPAWSWKEVAASIGVLLTVLAVALLRSFLARRHLERQQAAQFAFSRQILQSQENERHRIAANLHDSLGQSLLIIKNQVWLATQPVADESVRRRLDEISGLTSQAIEEVRQITHDLRPYQLDKLGLTRALRALTRRLEENSLIEFESDLDDVDGLFDQESEMHVFRIVQECLNNIVKHSGATKAALTVKRRADSVSVSVSDQGRGFDAGRVGDSGLQNGSFGLRGITERSRILGGKVEIDSQPGSGVRLTVVIPVSSSSTNET